MSADQAQVNMLKILVVIANYGEKNDGYLRRLIQEYRSLPHSVHIVVLTNVNKEVEGATEVLIHRPLGDPWTFPFAHKAILSEHIDQFDLFIYSEDDTLVGLDNIEAFLAATEVLAADEIAGFLRVEKTPDGQDNISTINGHFHWDPNSVVKRGEYTFAYFSNEHAACYILTREQLRRAVQSGGFGVGPHEDKYDLLVTAATDPYTQCGFRKLICISNIERFLIAHLPNKYIGMYGLEMGHSDILLGALAEIAHGRRAPTVLCQHESNVQYQRWSKPLYEAPREDILEAIGPQARTVLSYGCGIGRLESELASRGFRVTAVPLDSVVGACLEGQSIEVVYGVEGLVWESIKSRRFECILVIGLLHLMPYPAEILRRMKSALSDRGVIIASVPNIMQARTLWRTFKGAPPLRALDDFESNGLHAASFWSMRGWFREAGLKVKRMTPVFPEVAPWWSRTAQQVFPPAFAQEYLIYGEPQ